MKIKYFKTEDTNLNIKMFNNFVYYVVSINIFLTISCYMDIFLSFSDNKSEKL